MAAQLPCPNCRSYKTVDQKRRMLWGGLAVTVLSLPWVLWLVPLFFVLTGLSMMVGSLFLPEQRRCRCRACGLQFPLPAPAAEIS